MNMKKNLIPLVAIAFVVAIVATGLFYGLFASKLREAASGPRAAIVVAARNLEPGVVLQAQDVRVAPWGGVLPKSAVAAPETVAGMTVIAKVDEGEPLLTTRLASADKGSAGMGIPSGMRAVSVHVADSSGVIAMLRPGHRVDIQVVANRPNNDAALRTLLQNIEVLAVSPQADSGAGRLPLPVITVLANPAEAEMLGLADSAAKIRIALRNPLDTARAPAGSLVMASLFRGLPAAETAREVASVPPPPAGPVSFWIRVAVAAPVAVEELNSSLAGGKSAELLQVAAFRSGFEVEQTIRRLQEKQQIEVLSASRVQAGNHGQAAFQLSARGSDPLAVNVQFHSLPSTPGTVRLRVQPETVTPGKDGVTTRRIDTELNVAEGRTFAVTGLFPPGRTALERLFPGQLKHPASQELVVLVTAQRGAVQSASLRR